MPGGFVKLDSGILDSSIWSESPETRIVWLTMLAMADSEGLVRATAPGISRAARVSLEATRKALSTFEAPDPDSRTLAHDGRRIERTDGGYRLLNYLKYRDKDYSAAERMRRFRERRKSKALRVTLRPVTQAEAEAEADVTDSPKVGRESVSYLPPPTERAERAVNDTVRSLHLRLGEMLCRLAEHPNSRRMVHDWSRAVTSYERPDGTKVKGVPDWRTIQSIDRLERSISDAEWWLAELEKGAEGGTL